MRPGDDRPPVPRVPNANRQREQRPVVETERTPAHVSWGRSPGHPAGPPVATRNPEPPIAVITPSAVVVRRPRPEVDPDPGPPVRLNRRPVSVVIRLPSGGDDWIPHRTVASILLPGAVLIERSAVHPQFRGKVRRGLRRPATQ